MTSGSVGVGGIIRVQRGCDNEVMAVITIESTVSFHYPVSPTLFAPNPTITVLTHYFTTSLQVRSLEKGDLRVGCAALVQE